MGRNDITLSVWIDDDEFMSGDWSAMHMVFRNLNGANFLKGQASVIQNYTESHEQYLANVSDMSGLTLEEGSLITLRSADGMRVYLEHRLGVHDAGVTHPGENHYEYAGNQYQEGA